MENKELKPLHPLPQAKEVEEFNWIIPQCCKEGWASCPHVLKKAKKIKRNIGL